MNTHHKKGKFLMALLFIAALFLLPYVVMLLWNGILPEVIGVKTITYWQAVGIFILSQAFFCLFFAVFIVRFFATVSDILEFLRLMILYSFGSCCGSSPAPSHISAFKAVFKPRTGFYPSVSIVRTP